MNQAMGMGQNEDEDAQDKILSHASPKNMKNVLLI